MARQVRDVCADVQAFQHKWSHRVRFCRHAKTLAKNDVDTHACHPLAPTPAQAAQSILCIRIQNCFPTRNPGAPGTHATPLPPSLHKRCTRFCATSHIASGATHEKSAPCTLVPLSVLSPRARARLGSTSPWLEGTSPVIVSALWLLCTDFSLRRLNAGMLLDRS